MTRLNRIRRITNMTEKNERAARTEVARANRELDDARASLESVWNQCRAAADNDSELPLKFGRALVETGWILADERTSSVNDATERLEQRTSAWAEQRTRLDALGRLVDRLEEADRSDQARRDQNDLDDIVATRYIAKQRIHATPSGMLS
jgi:flagellar biosynthesis chaperone FliJ